MSSSSSTYDYDQDYHNDTDVDGGRDDYSNNDNNNKNKNQKRRVRSEEWKHQIENQLPQPEDFPRTREEFLNRKTNKWGDVGVE